MRSLNKHFFCAAALALYSINAMALTDTVRVMAYNVLYYGNGCQGPNGNYHNYLRTIVAYANPDILGLDKMASIPVSPDDKYGTAPTGFADSIIRYALDPAFSGRYAYCPFTNNARSSSGTILFYDQRKFGFVSIVSSYANITDFNTYKLYYKDPNLATTHDTTFLYVLPCHDRSGDENEEVRKIQIEEEVRHLKDHFTRLPNFINMGDFNVRNSDEPFYQILTATKDTAFRFYDAPFSLDHTLAYPAKWDHNAAYTSYFTTSTRESATVPNSCGTGGGAKNWYDHIFLSSWIAHNIAHVRYIPGSYHTIGNDGQRMAVSINNANVHPNTSAPQDVIEALYQMSNKYPVTLSLEINTSNGHMPADPELKGVQTTAHEEATCKANKDALTVHFPKDMKGQEIKVVWLDDENNKVSKKEFKISDLTMDIAYPKHPGSYKIQITSHHNIVLEQAITVH
jgi:hypothetical protein